ncbi:hypothetical protein [Spirosoma panaciterrae]|nr:hypothetical protein [Spirosoma panaciterrae]
MYQFLQKYVGSKTAGILTAFWYLLLLFLIFYYYFLPSGQFRYADW